MKSKKTVLAVVSLVLGVVGSAFFWPWKDEPTVSIPVSPERITEPGRYLMGDGRFIEISSEENGVEFREGWEDSVNQESSIEGIVSYSIREVPSVRLSGDWSVEFVPPDEFEIRSDAGVPVRRKFGENDIAAGNRVRGGSVIRIRNEEQDVE